MPIQTKESAFTLAASLVFMLLRVLLRDTGNGFGVEITLLLLLLFIVVLWVIRHFTGVKLKSLDEMDLTIRSQAAIIATHGFGAVVMCYALALYLIYRGSACVPLPQVINLAYFSWLSLYAVWSGSIMILYKTGAWHVR